jgi:hypothetical protein
MRSTSLHKASSPFITICTGRQTARKKEWSGFSTECLRERKMWKYVLQFGVTEFSNPMFFTSYHTLSLMFIECIYKFRRRWTQPNVETLLYTESWQELLTKLIGSNDAGINVIFGFVICIGELSYIKDVEFLKSYFISHTGALHFCNVNLSLLCRVVHCICSWVAQL